MLLDQETALIAELKAKSAEVEKVKGQVLIGEVPQARLSHVRHEYDGISRALSATRQQINELRNRHTNQQVRFEKVEVLQKRLEVFTAANRLRNELGPVKPDEDTQTRVSRKRLAELDAELEKLSARIEKLKEKELAIAVAEFS
ncbi:hypothetical protein [Blastopirellula marina]|uniref:Uncharacterized protein n=1 Tax=Blastopirellula marina TaxID=124 RepID=A0A2S8GID4_9BACT|nr:hypothetical protein [Blastopirellula marina]PQO44208.1 hypothetical protein C5Y93_19745 [Blastopirellula marina]